MLTPTNLGRCIWKATTAPAKVGRLAAAGNDDLVFADPDIVALEIGANRRYQARLARDGRVLHDAVDGTVERPVRVLAKLGSLEDLGRGEAPGEGDDLRVGQILDRLTDQIALVVTDVVGKSRMPVDLHCVVLPPACSRDLTPIPVF